ncbi:hypothetical protein ACROYT_G010192 [Oculina patagonica]
METTAINAENESDVTQPPEETPQFDDETLRAIAEIYMNQGNEEYTKEDYINAIDFYTEAIKVNCRDEELKAKLYSNRATVYFLKGNYPDSLSDANVATELQPTYLKAIVIGASACGQLNLFKETITWCDMGLAIDKNNQYLLELRTRSGKKQKKLQETGEEKAKNQSVDPSHQQPVGLSQAQNVQTTKQFNTGIRFLSCHNLRLGMAQEMGDKAAEGEAYGKIGNAYQVLGSFNKAIDYHELQLKIAKQVEDKTGEGSAYSNIGNVYQCLGDFNKAREYFAAHLRIAKEVVDKPAEGVACGNIGKVYQSLGDFKQAMYYHKLHLRIAKDVDDKAEQGTATGHLGSTYQSLGDFKLAIDYHKEQLRIAKEVGNNTGEGEAYGNLGIAYQGLGNFREALENLKRHLSIKKEEGDKAGKGSAMGHLGNAYQSLGDFKTAIAYQEKHLRIAKEVGDKAGEGTAYGNLGNAFQNLGDYKRAIEYHSLHLSIAKEVGDKTGEGEAYGDLGHAFQSLGDFMKAIEYHKMHLSIAKKVGDKAGEGAAYGHLGNVYQAVGDFKTALHFHKLHLGVAKDVGNKAMAGAAHGNLGSAYQSLGDSKKAIDYHSLNLRTSKEVGDKVGEGIAYGNLGRAYQGLGDYERAVDHHCLHLSLAKEVGDKAREGAAYSELGNAYRGLGDFQKAMHYHNLHLGIAKEVGDKAGQGVAFGNIGNDYQSLGLVKKAIEYHGRHLEIAKEVGDQAGEGAAYGHLGIAYSGLNKFQKAMDYCNLQLSVAKNIGDKLGEGAAYGNLGNVWQKLDDFRKAIHYHYLHLRIAKDAGDKAGEAASCSNLGTAFQSLRNFKKAMHYQRKQLKSAKEIGDKAGEGRAYHALGCSLESLGLLPEALNYSQLSVKAFNNARSLLKSNDEWKIGFRKKYDDSYTALRRILLKQEMIVDAMFAAETGRAQALSDLLESRYGIEAGQAASIENEGFLDQLSHSSSSTIFLAVSPTVIDVWVLSKGNDIQYTKKELDEANIIDSLIKEPRLKRWGSHSLDSLPQGNSTETKSDNPLVSLYNNVFGLIADQIQGDELIIVPDGPLWLAPYAAFVGSDSKYLCESFRIRLIPSLTSLKLITECPDGYHCKNGALLVGDPWVEEFPLIKRFRSFSPLLFARKEVEMIGEMINVAPLVGKEASKDQVLKSLGSVALVHIAAHYLIEACEIVLSPNPERASRIPKPEDYILTMEDVLSIQVRARLVVLSCCQSGKGEINPEGVVGMARAFLGAGARSVLVSLWVLEDRATMEFMRRFYHHLVEGRSASESLNQTMNELRESDGYSDVKYWAPFVLIGDDVTLEFE